MENTTECLELLKRIVTQRAEESLLNRDSTRYIAYSSVRDMLIYALEGDYQSLGQFEH